MLFIGQFNVTGCAVDLSFYSNYSMNESLHVLQALPV